MECPGSKLMDSKKRVHQSVSLLVAERANSSASVVLVVTVRCRVDFQSIIALNRVKAYPCVLRRVSGSLLYKVSLLTMNTLRVFCVLGSTYMA